MDLENTEKIPVNFIDLNVNDIVIVDGRDIHESNIKFNEEIGTVINMSTDRDIDGMYFLISFNNWFDGHIGGGNKKCSRNNCWWLWVENNDNNNIAGITFYKNRFNLTDIFSSLNENEEDWYKDIISDFEKQKDLPLVEVVGEGYYYPTYLDAMYDLNITGLNHGKYQQIRYERNNISVDDNYEEILLTELPFLGIPEHGDICYFYDKYYKHPNYNATLIYKLKRVSDGKEFIMSDEGFRHI
jgi:hypothetical protein